MSEEIRYQIISYGDVADDKYPVVNDPYHIINLIKERKDVLLKKPTGFNPTEICSIIALYGDIVVGIVIFFTNRISIDGEEIEVQSGTILYSHPDYKKYGVGGDLFYYFTTNLKTGAITGGISQQALPLYRALKYTVFNIPRYICLVHSRSVLEKKVHLKGNLLKCLSSITDVCLRSLRFISISCNQRISKYKIERLTTVTEDILNIINSDPHKFKEVHDKKWFDWNLNYTFNNNPQNHKDLYQISINKEVVGFVLLKYEFFEQASSRGFKNVMIASLMEWGIKNTADIDERDICAIAIKLACKDSDAIQIGTFDKKATSFLKKSGSAKLGDANMGVYLRGKIKAEAKNIKNWRVRLAVSDTLID